MPLADDLQGGARICYGRAGMSADRSGHSADFQQHAEFLSGKTVVLVTGNFGKPGGNNLHTFLIPLLSHQDENKPSTVRTVQNDMFPIAGVYPPNILPSEIDNSHPEQVRVLWVDSGNPVNTIADTTRLLDAFKQLDLLVVVDVAMTETARHTDYILPARSQFEKYTGVGVQSGISENYFPFASPDRRNQRQSVARGGNLFAAAGAHGRCAETFPVAGSHCPLRAEGSRLRFFLGALLAAFKLRPKWQYSGPTILYRTLGRCWAIRPLPQYCCRCVCNMPPNTRQRYSVPG